MPEACAEWELVVDTDQYSGNFERELTAFCTGCVGDCGVGEEEAQAFHDEVGTDWSEAMDDGVEWVSGEDGCSRPCRIVPTPGYWNNGIGQHYRDGEAAHRPHVLPVQHFPAYQSVAIGFPERPTKEVLELVRQRAIEFTRRYAREIYPSEGIRILGLRLLRNKLVVTEEQVPDVTTGTGSTGGTDTIQAPQS